MPAAIAGPAAAALASLTSSQVSFLRALPKVELHAHLNGCIPLPALQELANRYTETIKNTKEGEGPPIASASSADTSSGPNEKATHTTQPNTDAIRDGIEKLKRGIELDTIQDFFGLFTAIYALTSTRESLAFATRAVLEDFLGPADDPASARSSPSCSSPSVNTNSASISISSSSSTIITSDSFSPQCTYLELRSTPRQTAFLTRTAYVSTILDEIERYPPSRAAFILALDRRMGAEVAEECVQIAIEMRQSGRRVVGVDLCGDPTAGDVRSFAKCFARAKEAGLGVTLHIAETSNSPTETLHLLAMQPDRLGHATFLDSEDARKLVLERAIAIEICLSSNLLCKTVPSLQDHHLKYHFSLNHPVTICTDDTLPFRTNLLAEYALLLAEPPLGLGLSEQDVECIARMGFESRFRVGDAEGGSGSGSGSGRAGTG